MKPSHQEKEFDFAIDAVDLARQLIGAQIFFDGVGGRIVETEAYDQSDPASHSFRGTTVRSSIMFGPAGYLYVYRSYGLHWCMNIVSGLPGHGAAVLLRAIEPLEGLIKMRERRGITVPDKLLCAGPGRLCQALGIDVAQNGMPMDHPRFLFRPSTQLSPVSAGPRIGITKATEMPWRFVLTGSPFLSKPFKGLVIDQS